MFYIDTSYEKLLDDEANWYYNEYNHNCEHCEYQYDCSDNEKKYCATCDDWEWDGIRDKDKENWVHPDIRYRDGYGE